MRDTIMARMAARTLVLALVAALAGCAAATRVAEIADIPLQAVGLSKPSVPEPPPLPPPRIRSIAMTVDAAPDLNADGAGNGLALILQVYKLRETTAFLQTPFDTFLKPEQERTALGSDLVDRQEIVLTPGQRLAAEQQLGNESPWLGVVALFRTPAAYRWRFVFKAAEVETSGVLIGAHACALTVTAGLTGNDAGGRPLRQLPPSCP